MSHRQGGSLARRKQSSRSALTIGANGGTAFVFSAFSVIEFQTDDRFTYREVERQTTTKRITSDSDPSQYVDVERSTGSC